jgi:trehalose synthase
MTDHLLNDLWWKNAIVYCLDVKTFADSDGDGWGDLVGLTNRIEYLAGLGITVLWLRPFHPSPLEDDGYDVSDYYGIDPRIGDHGDFVEMIRAADQRGIRIVLDLVVNHTSTQHPWFQEARTDRSSPVHDYYVWADEEPDPRPDKVVFPDTEDGIWTYDDQADRWYLHHFYRHEPELNFANEKVREEIHKVMAFWLQLGVSGFRLDSVPYLIDTGEIMGTGEPRAHEWLRDLREFSSRRRGDSVLIGEADVELDELRRYFGDERGNQLHMVFNFLANQAMFLSLARGDARPLAACLDSLPDLPRSGHWLQFVRNHDELNLAKLSDDERAEVFDAFAPDEGERIYGRGIRRRASDMFGHDRRRLELAYSLMFALPGSPVLLSGEEIGMGDRLELPDRLPVRTPMQWSDGPNGGFSSALPEDLVRPMAEGPGGPGECNVADQLVDPGSFLTWMERLAHSRRRSVEIAAGRWRTVDVGDDAILAIEHTWRDSSLLTLHNVGDAEATPKLEDRWHQASFVFGGPGTAATDDPLPSLGYRWLRVAEHPVSVGGPP